MANINYIFTDAHQKGVCEHYGEDITTLEEWEICDLLDRLIEEALYNVTGGDIK